MPESAAIYTTVPQPHSFQRPAPISTVRNQRLLFMKGIVSIPIALRTMLRTPVDWDRSPVSIDMTTTQEIKCGR